MPLSAGIWGHWGRTIEIMTDSALHGNQFWNADEIIGDQVEEEVGSDAGDAAMLGLAHGAVLLTPTEDALDHRAAGLRHAIAGVPGGAPVDGATPATGVLRDVRRDLSPTQLGYIAPGVVTLLAPKVRRWKPRSRASSTSLGAMSRSAVAVAWLS